MIARRERAVTGSHVLIVLSAFFSVIIVANLVLAVIADRSWTGLVVPDSYVESQRFNDRLAASRNQAQLGWQGSLFLDGRHLGFDLEHADGTPVPLASARVTLDRPIGTADDLGTIEMTVSGGRATLDGPLPAGAWNVRIDVTAVSGEVFRLAGRLSVRQFEGDARPADKQARLAELARRGHRPLMVATASTTARHSVPLMHRWRRRTPLISAGTPPISCSWARPLRQFRLPSRWRATPGC